MTRRGILRGFAGAPLVAFMPTRSPQPDATTISPCDDATSPADVGDKQSFLPEDGLARRGIRHLSATGCTTSICVESTVRDAMFRDHLRVLLADCMSEPIGSELSGTNHEAPLLSTQLLLGWTSEACAKAVSA